MRKKSRSREISRTLKKKDLEKAEQEIKKADDAAVSDNEYNTFIKKRQEEGKPLPAGETLKRDAEALRGAEKKATEASKAESPSPEVPKAVPPPAEPVAPPPSSAPAPAGSMLGDLGTKEQ